VKVALPSAPTRLTTRHRLPATTITGRATTNGDDLPPRFANRDGDQPVQAMPS
jgi:hypothetical protein